MPAVYRSSVLSSGLHHQQELFDPTTQVQQRIPPSSLAQHRVQPPSPRPHRSPAPTHYHGQLTVPAGEHSLRSSVSPHQQIIAPGILVYRIQICSNYPWDFSVLVLLMSHHDKQP